MSARDFIYATKAVRGCQRCVSHRDGTRPAEAVKAGTEVTLAVLLPEFGIPKERFLRALIAERWTENEVAYVPVRGCDGSSANCRSNLESQLHSMAGIKLILAVGGDALKAWRSDQTLARSAGQIGLMLDKWPVMPIHHPDSVVRGFVDRADYRRMLEDAWGVTSGQMPVEFFGFFDCGIGKCSEEAVEWDADKVGFCKKHWKTHGTKWKKERKVWIEEKTIAAQPKLDLGI